MDLASLLLDEYPDVLVDLEMFRQLFLGGGTAGRGRY
jgi:hypothetical protein